MTNLDKTPAHIRDKALDLGELADDIEQLIRERDEAREEADELRESGRILREALRDAAAHRDELRADLDRAQAATAGSVPRVITPDELRERQVVVVWALWWAAVPVGEVIHIRSIEHNDDGTITLRAPGQLVNFDPDEEQVVLLADAPADPEPEPWKPEKGDVGIVTHFQGEKLDEPVAARFSGKSWYRLGSVYWPDRTPNAYPSEVTVVRAKVVPDDE